MGQLTSLSPHNPLLVSNKYKALITNGRQIQIHRINLVHNRIQHHSNLMEDLIIKYNNKLVNRNKDLDLILTLHLILIMLKIFRLLHSLANKIHNQMYSLNFVII